MPEPQAQIPPLRGIDRLINVLDAFATRRPRHRPVPAVVLTGGPDPETLVKVVTAYRSPPTGHGSSTRAATRSACHTR